MCMPEEGSQEPRSPSIRVEQPGMSLWQKMVSIEGVIQNWMVQMKICMHIHLEKSYYLIFPVSEPLRLQIRNSFLT